MLLSMVTAMSEDRRRKYWILGAMSGVLGLVVFDETVVGVALPTIQRDLGMTQVALHWAVNAYLLTFGCFVALAGRLGDTLGRHRLFLVGVAVFGLASLAAGRAPSGSILVAARAIQGVGAAIIFPAAFAIVTGLFSPEERGTAFGMQTTVGGVFMSMGPLVGGIFSQTVSWRWIFLINLPVVLAIGVVVMAAWVAPAAEQASEAPRERKFDLSGLLALLLGLTATTIGLMQGNEWGWSDPITLFLLAVGAIGLAVFVLLETREQQPLIDLSLFRIPPFAGGVLIFFVFQFDKIVVFVFVPLFLQRQLDFSPIEAGLPLVAAILPTLVTSLVAGRSADRFGPRGPTMVGLIANGTALLVLGLGALAGSYPTIFASLMLWGTVLPFASVVPRGALMGAVPRSRQGQASGLNLTVQMMGGTIGMAVATILLTPAENFSIIFWITGVLVLAVTLAAWLTFDRKGGARG